MSISDKGSVAILAAGSYMAGPIARYLQNNGYKIVGVVRPTTDMSAMEEICDTIHRGNLSDKSFVEQATAGCVAIINFLNQLMPPKDTIHEQLENDLPPLKAALEAALTNSCVFIHTSGNFSIPTKGKLGGVIRNELPEKPEGANIMDEESWSTFEHEGGMKDVATLAEAKHREDHAVNDFVKERPESMARVIIPAGIYGPGLGKKFSFWDLAAHLYLEGQFGDFVHAFVHVEDVCKVYLAVLEHGEAGGRYPVYGESITVRSFVEKYVKACDVEMKKDGPVCSEEESNTVYDDRETRSQFGIEYEHTLDKSLGEVVASLRERGLLMVKPKDQH